MVFLKATKFTKGSPFNLALQTLTWPADWFHYRVDSFFDESISSLGILPGICEALHRYELFDYFKSWFHNSSFPNYSSWETIVKNKINKYEENAWNEYPLSHPNLDIARAYLENVLPHMFWAIADFYLDLVAHQHVQVRLMGNFGLNGGIPWLVETDGSLCFTCREITKHFVTSFLTVPLSSQILTHSDVTYF